MISILHLSKLAYVFLNAELIITWGRSSWKIYQCCASRTLSLSLCGHASTSATCSLYFLKISEPRDVEGKNMFLR